MSRRVELNRELKNRCIKTKQVSITRGIVLSEGKFHVFHKTRGMKRKSYYKKRRMSRRVKLKKRRIRIKKGCITRRVVLNEG